MENKRSENTSFVNGVGDLIRSGLEKRKKDTTAIFYDAVVLLVAFVFSRCHIAFGAYPLANAFVAVLPSGIWLGLIGAVAGSLTLGKSGVIHAIISIIVVFLRLIISSGKSEEVPIFHEPLIMRISAAVIGAFVGAAYEILLAGFAFTSVVYGVFSVLLSALFTFLLSGVFDGSVSFSDFLTSKRNIFAKGKSDKQKFSLYLFEATFLLFVFLISLSLKGYSVLGISPAYIFSGFITLLVAKRFGPFRALCVGFVSSLGISSLYSVAFALVGLAGGLLFSVGMAYAFIGGGVILSVWCFYSGGALGFLSTFPEYVCAALLSSPLLRKLPSEEKTEAERQSSAKEASNMVATTAVAYKSASLSSLMLDKTLSSIAASLHRLGEEEAKITRSEYRDLAIECAKSFCHECRGYNSCILETPAPCIENIDLIADKLTKKERLFAEDSLIVPRYCHNSEEFFGYIEREAAALEERKYKNRKIEAIADEYELFSKLISEAVRYNERESAQNKALSERLTKVIEDAGLHEGTVRAFGERRKHFILAGEDKDGSIITSSELHEGIEECANVKLSTPEYYRKGDIALFECATAPMFRVEFATAGRSSDSESVSGDTAISFESEDGHFYSLIADGMGSGEAAHRTSHFTADFLSRILSSPVSKSTAFHILNHIIKSRSEECSSTVDLFDFDLFCGEALFFKCGAAPSYIKRDNSIFRIRSETAPLGLMRSIDAEKIRPEVKGGDYVIMLSDGVSQTSEDSAWLLELLSSPVKCGVREYADLILEGAKKHAGGYDDMSVSVIKIIKL